MKRSRLVGFTLVELLVIVAIIGILATFLMPVVQIAIDRSKSAGCQANLRRIGQGLTQFVADNDGILPNSVYGSVSAATDTGANRKWMDVIADYVGEEKTFLCPSDAGAKYRPASKLGVGETSTDYGSYGMNGTYGKAGDSQTPPRSSAAYTVRWSRVAAPSRTVWVVDTDNRAEANGSFGFTWLDAAANPVMTSSPPRKLDKILERHGKFANVLFCDGHVEVLRLEALAATTAVNDPIDGATKNVMTLLTIEAD